MAVHQLPKLRMRVRFPSSAPNTKPLVTASMATRVEIEHQALVVCRAPKRAPKPVSGTMRQTTRVRDEEVG